VNLEEEFEQRSIADDLRIEHDFDRFCMCAVVAVGRIRNIAAAVADTRGQDTAHLADQILHAPETASRKYRAFRRRCHVMPFRT
jgi:hypothetical protein